MTRIQTLACSACLIFVEVAPAGADATADPPTSLRMRARPSTAAHPSPMPRGKRVAQPAPDQPPGGDPPPAPGTGAPPPPAPEPTPATDPPAPTATPEAAAPVPEATAAPTSTAAPAAPEAAPGDTEEVIVVTGTLIDRPGFKAPTPMTVIGDAELRQGGRENVAEVLADIPQFRFSINPSLNQGLNTIGSAGGDLRALGFVRTLYLLNGRRFIGELDLNSIPFAAVKRIDVVTGGASATYGSGAVAGVINTVLNDRLNGVEAAAQTGISSRGDGSQYRFDITGGSDFAGGRGNVLLAAEYAKDQGIDPIASRKNIARFGVVGNPTFTPQNGQARTLLLPDVGFTFASEGGLVLSGPFAGQQFLPGGALAPFHNGLAGSGGDGPSLNTSYDLRAPLDRLNLLAAAVYDVTREIRLSGDFRLANVRSGTAIFPDFSAPLSIKADNAFLPAGARDQLVAAGQPSFLIGRYNTDFGLVSSDVERQTYQGSIALDGSLGKSLGKTFKWNAYYTHGEQIRDEAFSNLRIGDNFARAVDSVIDTRPGSPTLGQPICRVALTTTTDCVPIDLFGQGAPSAEALRYVLGTTSVHVRDKLDVAAGTLRGEAFSLWAGPVSTAIGVEYRKESSGATVDALSAAQRFPTFFFRPYGRDRVSVIEAFGEVLVPLVKDVPLLQKLEFNGAARYSDYSTSGGIWAWKLGLTDELLDGLRLRAVRSRDIRAPALDELGGPGATNIQQIADPFRPGETPFVTVRTTGNTDLVPEEADTTTAGVVFEPSFIPGLSLAADYYSIDISGAITALNAPEILRRCSVDQRNPLCAQIDRDPPGPGQAFGPLTGIRSSFFNIASFETRGVDMELSYRTQLGRWIASAPGRMIFRMLASHVDALIFDDAANRSDTAGDVGGTVILGVPRWRGVASAAYEDRRFTVDLRARYVGGGHFNSQPGGETSCDPDGRTALCPDIKGRTYVDLGLQYTLPYGLHEDSRITLFGSVANLFDRDPPVFPNRMHYDVVGRYFTFGVRAKI
jgi:iron complex outermembrane receptor protein